MLRLRDGHADIRAYDGRIYRVRDLPDRVQAANLLARLRLKTSNFLRHIKNRRLQTSYKAVIMENYNNDNFTSYTVSKGQKIYLCLRERDASNKFTDENTLFFVILHELAHVMTISTGHTPEFWQNFRILLRKAIQYSYYKHQSYHIRPQKYCGMLIASNPLM